MDIFLLVYTAIYGSLGCAIAVLLFRRRLQTRLPLFVSYIIYSSLDSVVRLALLHWSQTTYFDGYWYTEIGEVALAVLSMRESLLSFFVGFRRLRWFGWVVRISMWVSLFYGIWKAVAQPPLATWRVSMVVSTELLFQYWIAAFGVLFFSLLLWFGIQVRRFECWVVYGFLLESVCVISGMLLRSIFGTKFLFLSQAIPGFSYIVGQVIWLRGILSGDRNPDVGRRLSQPDVDKMNAVLDRQMELLKRLFVGAASSGKR